jgi:GMP synthase-like glutamine amidotransferase
MQISVIDPAVRVAELECFNHLARHSPLPLTYHLPAMFGLDSLRENPESLAGIVILGSASSVYDGEVWQKELEEWLKPQLERGVPTLGLCYGHQLLAHLYGAKIGFAFEDKRKLAGWRKMRLEPSPLAGPMPQEGCLLVSHREVVLDCPRGWRAVGKSPEVIFEALAHERLPLWTFQAHPEATPAFLRHQSIPTAAAGLFALGHRLVQAFLDYVKNRR